MSGDQFQDVPSAPAEQQQPIVFGVASAKEQPVRSFVRSAWTLLLFQLIAAFAAVGVTAWAAFQVRPLFAQRQTLQKDIAQLQKVEQDLQQRQKQLSAENARLAEHLTRGRQEARVRASEYIRDGINKYHAGAYDAAIASYSEALSLDPDNAYVLDLKSYAQFRAGDLDGAVASISTALAADPSYVYGYSELARYACAAKRISLAEETFARATTLHPQAAALFRNLMRDDGQFATLCAGAKFEERQPAVQPGVVTPN